MLQLRIDLIEEKYMTALRTATSAVVASHAAKRNPAPSLSEGRLSGTAEASWFDKLTTRVTG